MKNSQRNDSIPLLTSKQFLKISFIALSNATYFFLLLGAFIRYLALFQRTLSTENVGMNSWRRK